MTTSIEEQKYAKVDWTSRASIESTFPNYRKEQLKMDAAGQARSKLVEIRHFGLRNPNNTDDLLIKTHLTIESNKRCAVYGVNGSGKTTLFEAISSGAIREFPTYLHLHHMKELELDPVKDAKSVLQTVMESHDFRNCLVYAENMITKLLLTEQDEKNIASLKANLEYVQKSMGTCRGKNAESDARAMLRVLGFDEVGEAAPLNSLSGGLRMRVALACMFYLI